MKSIQNSPLRSLVFLFGFMASFAAEPFSRSFASGPGLHGRALAQEPGGTKVEALAGAEIDFRDQQGRLIRQVTTDPNGYYKVDLVAGTYFYRVRASGYREEKNNRGLALTLSKGYAIQHFHLTKTNGSSGSTGPGPGEPEPPVEGPSNVLVGQVYEKVGSRFLGVAGATVTLRGKQTFRARTRPPTSEDEEDESGFEKKLPVGSYMATVTAEGFEPYRASEPIEIVTDRVTTRDFVLKRIAPRKPVNLLVGQVYEKTDRGMIGLPGALVTVRPTPRSAGDPPVYKVHNRPASSEDENDRSGYRLKLPVGRYQATAAASGYRLVSHSGGSNSAAVEIRPDKVTTRDFVLEKVPPPPTQCIQGSVLAIEGERQMLPPRSTRVTLHSVGLSAPVSLRLSLNGSGNFRQVVAPGVYQVTAEAPGYIGSSTPPIVVLPGRCSVVNLTIVKRPPVTYSLSGTVFGKFTKMTLNDGILTPTPVMEPLKNAEVRARLSPTGPWLVAVTDVKGEYRIRLPGPGIYDALARKSGFHPVAKQVVVNRPLTIRNFILTKPEQYVLEGVVKELVSSANLDIPGATLLTKPVTGARVHVRRGTWSATRVTGSDGRYHVLLPGPGSYDCEAMKTGYQNDSKKVVVVPGRQRSRQDFTLRREYELKGVVYEESIKLVGDDPPRPVTTRKPLPGARVKLTTGGGMKEAITDGKGRYRLKVTGVGRYACTASKKGYRSDNRSTLVSQPVAVQDFILKRSKSSSTLVVQAFLSYGYYETKTPIARAIVKVSRNGSKVEKTGRTDSKGECRFENLDHGHYTVVVSRAKGEKYRFDFHEGTEDVKVDRPEVTLKMYLNMKFAKPKKGDLKVLVLTQSRGESGPGRVVPIAGATVTISKKSNGAKALRTGGTNELGRTTMDGLNYGSYYVEASCPGYWAKRVTYEVRKPDDELKIFLTPHRKVKIQVPDACPVKPKRPTVIPIPIPLPPTHSGYIGIQGGVPTTFRGGQGFTGIQGGPGPGYIGFEGGTPTTFRGGQTFNGFRGAMGFGGAQGPRILPQFRPRGFAGGGLPGTGLPYRR